MQLTFGAVQAAGEAWTQLLEVLRDAITAITPKELAFALDIQPSYLSDALRGNDRKSIKAEWIPTILAMSSEWHRIVILQAMASPLGLAITRNRELTPEERLERLEQRIAAELGPAGMRLVEENRK